MSNFRTFPYSIAIPFFLAGNAGADSRDEQYANIPL